MHWTTLLFSFRGRINRARYWQVALLCIAVWAVYLVGVLFLMHRTDNLLAVTGTIAAGWLASFPLAFISLWVGAAAATKRLHDRDKSGWWLIPYWIIPTAFGMASGEMPFGIDLTVQGVIFIVGIWAMIDLGFLKGTEGPNRFGPDPLQQG